MDISLVVYRSEGVQRVISVGGRGRDMGWFVRRVTGGYLVVGGVDLGDWDILVIKFDESLNLLWSLVLGSAGDEYAYSGVELMGMYYIVGRTNFRGNWDGFVLAVSREGIPGGSWIVGSSAKDYLRFIGFAGGKLIATGRTEARGESDILLYRPLTQSYRIIDIGEYDYGRAIAEKGRGIILGGDLVKEGNYQGFILYMDRDLNPLEGYSVGREDVESLRMVAGGELIAGYTYSFSIDNDLFVGSFTRKCPSFVKPVAFRIAHARIQTLRFPLKIKEYPITLKEADFNLYEVKPAVRFVCAPQE